MTHVAVMDTGVLQHYEPQDDTVETVISTGCVITSLTHVYRITEAECSH